MWEHLSFFSFKITGMDSMLAQDIYTIKVNKGIRVALCSLSVEKCQGLAFKMKEILDSLK